MFEKNNIIEYQEKSINEETISKLEEMKARIIMDSQHTEDKSQNWNMKTKT